MERITKEAGKKKLIKCVLTLCILDENDDFLIKHCVIYWFLHFFRSFAKIFNGNSMKIYSLVLNVVLGHSSLV